MARNVFISFRYVDGNKYKDKLASLFDKCADTVDYSEDVNRSNMGVDTIQQYLYEKLKRSSITIVLLTPLAVNHKRNAIGLYDDWMYDEIRYSLEDRKNNRTNGLIAVYTPETKDLLMTQTSDGTSLIKKVDNLFRENMMNVKPEYKKNKKAGVFDRDYDSYCSLVSWSEFISDIDKYIRIASEKRNSLYKYKLVKRLLQ